MLKLDADEKTEAALQEPFYHQNPKYKCCGIHAKVCVRPSLQRGVFEGSPSKQGDTYLNICGAHSAGPKICASVSLNTMTQYPSGKVCVLN